MVCRKSLSTSRNQTMDEKLTKLIIFYAKSFAAVMAVIGLVNWAVNGDPTSPVSLSLQLLIVFGIAGGFLVGTLDRKYDPRQ